MRIRPPAKYNVAQDFLQTYSEALDFELVSPAEVSRLINLRCSQLPFCPTSLLLEYKLKGLNRTMNLMGSYYTRVGTAVHEVMQTYLAKTGKFMADYICHECGKIYPMSIQHECCGFDTQYHEVLIDFMGIVGHIDAIFQDRDGNWWILDFKTSSLQAAPDKQKKPGVVYQEQVETYAYLIYRQYGILVKGVILVFIPRDNPKVPTVWSKPLTRALDFKVIHARLSTYRKLHARVMVATTASDMWKISRHKCANEWCRYCKLSDETLKKKIRQAMRSPHPLPMKNLKVPDRGDATVIVHHSSHFLKPEKIKVPSIALIRGREDELGLEVRRALTRLHKTHLRIQQCLEKK